MMEFDIDYIHSDGKNLVITISVPIVDYCNTQGIDINSVMNQLAMELR
jgi:hypothetical protein